jgi:hypothetical protein
MGRRRNAAAAALIAIPTLLLGGLSLLSTRAALNALPADAALEQARLGRRPAAETLVAAAQSYGQSAQSFESARYRTAAASALVSASRAGAKVPEAQIEQAVRAALAASPASPFNWSRLAWLRFRAGDTKGAAAAWQMSVLTGRYKPPVMATRIELGVRLLRSQDRAFEEAVQDQILVAARTDPRQLAELASRLGIQPLVRAALVRDADARTGYEKANRQLAVRILQDMKAPRP